MHDTSLFQQLSEHAGWIAALFGMGMGGAGLLIALGVLKSKVNQAYDRAEKFTRELYRDDGVTNYVPRSELNRIVADIQEKILSTKSEMLGGCAANRNDCRDVICRQIDLLRFENEKIHKTINMLEEKYHDQNLGFVALSTQLSMLIRQAGADPPAEIVDIERRLKASAADRMRRYNDINLMTKKGGDD